ncbi:hypothetical protein KSP40_PGU013368 [Platanthera guangdongensis]|uniref:Uncharacterized protein n=1 Tax=Platanthera guangdongensis TaxID=2320717 RepID=A0ABR2LBJ7_9ASPA
MVMRCILTTPRLLDDWKRMSIFSLIFKSGEKLYKLIIDSDSCVNIDVAREQTLMWVVGSMSRSPLACLGRQAHLSQVIQNIQGNIQIVNFSGTG